MYFAMDEIGFENAEKIKTLASEADRWRFLFNAAQTYGFDGIHITPSLYKMFSLDIDKIPDYFSESILTFHVGGVYNIVSESLFEAFDNEIKKGFEIAVKHSMHDVSIHPPFIYQLTITEKNLTLEHFKKTVDKWLNVFMKHDVSLSLETHVAGEWFLFDGLNDFVKFIDIFPCLGVLIDISHNYYEPQYSEDDIINILGNKNVKGLHISDALRSVEFEKGTHLAIGDGTIDFPKLLKGFKKFPNLYSVLEIKSENYGIEKSLQKLRDYIINER